MDKPRIVCLTPIKNEAWILERFLKCASLWADHIIVADQGSDDGSREIARKFPKVQLIENESDTFNEPERQKLLIEAARKLPGPNLLIALDADEFLTANFRASKEWELVMRAVPGTIINFQWAVVLPDRESYYLFPTEFPLGYLDDGAPHEGLAIHSPRLPLPEKSPRISLRDIKVLHLSLVDFERFKSKVRWYQCWEFLKGRWDSRLIDFYRWYHRDFCVPAEQRRALPPEWTAGYGSALDLGSIPSSPFYRWDREVLELFRQHGTKRFRKLAVWEPDWEELHKRIYNSTCSEMRLKDPRKFAERWLHSWLERTQPFYSHYAPKMGRALRLQHRLIRELARAGGW